MNKGCVSVVIPVYNVEKYLKECIDSVIRQTYTNWELILIDDGSCDKSGEICDEFSNRDSRIHVLHQINQGVSFARNKGIEAAKGEYLIFIDSDDWIDDQMFEEMIKAITDRKADACYCDRYYKDQGKIINALPDTFPELIDAKNVLIKHLHYEFIASPCLGMIKRDKIKHCYFDTEIHILEDWEYNFRMLSKLDTITILKKPFYHYRTVIGSASKSKLNPKKLTCFLIPNKVNQYIQTHNLPYEVEAKYIPIFLINHMLVILANNDFEIQYSNYLKKESRKHFFYALKSKHVSKRQKIYITMSAISPRIFCFAYHLKYGGKYHD